MTAVILAGGKGVRMGADKAFLTVDGVPLIERVLTAAQAACERAIIIANTAAAFEHMGVDVFCDIHPGFGSLGGLYTGLFYAETEAVFALGCDMPFIEPRLMEYIISVREDADIAVPVLGEYYEPLFSVYSKACIDEVKQSIRAGRCQIVSFFNRMKIRKVSGRELRAIDPELDSLMNLNTPEDIDRAEIIARRRKKDRT
ncbi:MAG: molybdenum cofactor guanylyltransferase [Deltaproteobacteria bacterium]|nr:molybdenum cofactor guanylyltransferase [Candidatus Zymogenaceae bacterium]